jgi:hypothetical protein
MREKRLKPTADGYKGLEEGDAVEFEIVEVGRDPKPRTSSGSKSVEPEAVKYRFISESSIT